MKFKLMFFALLLSFALCAPAMAEMKTFGSFKVDVPNGWTSQQLPAESGKGVVLGAPDKSASISIAIAPTGGMTIKDIANAQAQALGGKAEEMGGVYHITGKMESVDVSVFISDADKGNMVVISIAGNINHPEVEGILDSIEEI